MDQSPPLAIVSVSALHGDNVTSLNSAIDSILAQGAESDEGAE